MPKQLMPIVNASTLLSDDAVRNVIPALQLQYDRDFLPVWRGHVPEIEFSFAGLQDIGNIPPDAWPIFLNKHSQDPGALGWHTDDGRIFGRVFVGDCLTFGVQWTTDLGHEVLETAVDPNAEKVWRMPNGDLAALEVCDAVEDDTLAYSVEVPGRPPVSCTDFVLPAYFSLGQEVKGGYDFRGHLTAPCPALTSGGYMSIQKASGGWTTLQKDRLGGLPGRRFLQANRHRRVKRRARTQIVVEL